MGDCKPSDTALSLFRHNGQGNEGDEGHGCHAGHEGNEEEGSEQDCKGTLRQGCGLPWIQGQDLRWFDFVRLDQELPWQDCEQEGIPTGQEEQLHQGLDYCRPEGQEGFGPEGLCRNQEGLCSLQEGQGALPMNMNMPRLQLRVWGCLRPWSAVALDGQCHL